VDEYDRLRALAAQLAMRGLTIDHMLHIAAPDASATITCRGRAEDGDRLWFFTGDGTPLAEADDEHLADAVLLVLGHLRRRAEETARVSS